MIQDKQKVKDLFLNYSHLRTHSKVLYFYLWSMSLWASRGESHDYYALLVSRSRMMDNTGLCAASVDYAIKELQSEGLIDIVTDTRPYSYRIH